MKLTIKQFLELQQYGYTVQEIREYEGISTDPQPAGADGADHAPGDTPTGTEIVQTEPQPEPQPEPKTDPAQTESNENETQHLLREMLGLIRAGNINNIGKDTLENVDGAAVMAEILTPSGETKK